MRTRSYTVVTLRADGSRSEGSIHTRKSAALFRARRVARQESTRPPVEHIRGATVINTPVIVVAIIKRDRPADRGQSVWQRSIVPVT